jgi:hypothetical protein
MKKLVLFVDGPGERKKGDKRRLMPEFGSLLRSLAERPAMYVGRCSVRGETWQTSRLLRRQQADHISSISSRVRARRGISEELLQTGRC